MILDSDVLKHEGLFRNIKIYNTEILQDKNVKIDWEKTQLIISSYGSQDAIKKMAINFGIKEEKIVELYDETKYY